MKHSTIITANVENRVSGNSIDSLSNAAIISYSDPALKIGTDNFTPTDNHSGSNQTRLKKTFKQAFETKYSNIESLINKCFYNPEFW